jgi:hypothetical protein
MAPCLQRAPSVCLGHMLLSAAFWTLVSADTLLHCMHSVMLSAAKVATSSCFPGVCVLTSYLQNLLIIEVLPTPPLPTTTTLISRYGCACSTNMQSQLSSQPGHPTTHSMVLQPTLARRREVTNLKVLHERFGAEVNSAMRFLKTQQVAD